MDSPASSVVRKCCPHCQHEVAWRPATERFRFFAITFLSAFATNMVLDGFQDPVEFVGYYLVATGGFLLLWVLFERPRFRCPYCEVQLIEPFEILGYSGRKVEHYHYHQHN
jgi:hypothetical protein